MSATARRRLRRARRAGAGARRRRTTSPSPATRRPGLRPLARAQRCSSSSWNSSGASRLPASSGGTARSERLVDLGDPPRRGDAAGHLRRPVALEVRAVGGDVVEQVAGLALLRPRGRSGGAARGRDGLPRRVRGAPAGASLVGIVLDDQLADVEPELVEAADPRSSSWRSSSRRSRRLPSARPTTRHIARRVARRSSIGSIDSGSRPAASRSIRPPTACSQARSTSCAHARGERSVVLGGLGVDEVGHQGAGVAAEEEIVERTIAPVEAFEVQPQSSTTSGVDQRVPALLRRPLGQHEAIGAGELQVARDQHRVEVVAAAPHQAADDEVKPCGSAGDRHYVAEMVGKRRDERVPPDCVAPSDAADVALVGTACEEVRQRLLPGEGRVAIRQPLRRGKGGDEPGGPPGSRSAASARGSSRRSRRRRPAPGRAPAAGGIGLTSWRYSPS